MASQTVAVIVGNRDFFPDRLVSGGRGEILAVLVGMGVRPIILDESDTKLGAVETWSDARRCADLLKAHREEIDGILVVLPNFGDERGVADSIKLSGLNVPILVQAYPDDLEHFDVARRRDAFCGKISVCNNLRQYGYPFSLTSEHTVAPSQASFQDDLRQFLRVCRVVRGLRGVRLGAIGARPSAFNTVRYSEKLLQAHGISVTTVDLSEIIAAAGGVADDAPAVRAKLAELGAYARSDRVPPPSLVRMAKLGIAIDEWMRANGLVASAIQCWTSVQRNVGVNVCALMSMMSEALMPSACEVDICGAVSMYALQLAADAPGALADWNNNYAGDPDKCVLFHCGNWARSFVPGIEISNQPIHELALGEGCSWGAMAGRVPAGPMSYARVSTDDTAGLIRTYVGDAAFTDDPVDTFGNRAVAQVPGLQKLLRYICKNGFEHHAAMAASHTATALAEAFETYLGWEVYHHTG